MSDSSHLEPGRSHRHALAPSAPGRSAGGAWLRVGVFGAVPFAGALIAGELGYAPQRAEALGLPKSALLALLAFGGVGLAFIFRPMLLGNRFRSVAPSHAEEAPAVQCLRNELHDRNDEIADALRGVRESRGRLVFDRFIVSSPNFTDIPRDRYIAVAVLSGGAVDIEVAEREVDAYLSLEARVKERFHVGAEKSPIFLAYLGG